MVASRMARLGANGRAAPPADAGAGESAPVALDTTRLQAMLCERAQQREWCQELTQPHGVVLDGPVWLNSRPGIVRLLAELIAARVEAGYRTSVVEVDGDGSIETLLGSMKPGWAACIALRFPQGRRGRTKFAKGVCARLEIPPVAARKTHALTPWSYPLVIRYLENWRAEWEAQGRPEGPLALPL